MKISQSSWKTLKDSRADNLSHQLMLRSGMITSIGKGLYAWLPMGVKVLDKVINIIEKHMSVVGYEKALMPIVQPTDLWKRSNRYDAYGKESLRMLDRYDHELVYGPTAEECLVVVFETLQLSYTRLPVKLYNTQWKFRDEIRPRFGVMRSREFLMKDAYSFDVDHTSAERSYREMFDAYMRIFTEMSLRVLPVPANTGVIGGSLSHEFHVLADNGEDQLFYDARLLNLDSITIETLDQYPTTTDQTIANNYTCTDIHTCRGIEVGHIYLLGDKYTQAMNVKTQGRNEMFYSVMGCYGIGVTRLVAAIIEQHNDHKGIVWPENISPYDYHLINLATDCQHAENLYDSLIQQGKQVLFDDTKDSAGSKLHNADLLGIPYQIIIGNKLIATGQCELKCRKTGLVEVISMDNIAIKQ